MPGYVYILLNPGMPGLVKIGRSDRHPNERARELHVTGTPYPFVAAYWRAVADPISVETLIHEKLAVHRVSQGREFFRVDITEAIHELQDLQVALAEAQRLEDKPRPTHLYWARIQSSGPFVRIGLTDIPPDQLEDSIADVMMSDYPNVDICICELTTFPLDSPEDGRLVLESFAERSVKGMPSVYAAVGLREVEKALETVPSRVRQLRQLEKDQEEELAIERRALDKLRQRI